MIAMLVRRILLMIALTFLVLALVERFKPDQPELLVTPADWPVCTMERGPPLPLQKAYHPNPNKGIA